MRGAISLLIIGKCPIGVSQHRVWDLIRSETAFKPFEDPPYIPIITLPEDLV
jgi:hypothetical protein